MILIRHGQSEFNVVFGQTRQDPGIEDPSLTDVGRSQIAEGAERLAKTLPRLPNRIVTSPYTRTLQSAHIMADILSLPIEIDADVREHVWFSCDIGSKRSKLEKTWPAIDFGTLPEVWWPVREEEADVDARAALFRTKMAAHPDWENALIVTHWGFIRSLTGHRVPNGTILRLDPTVPHPDGAEVVSTPEP